MQAVAKEKPLAKAQPKKKKPPPVIYSSKALSAFMAKCGEIKTAEPLGKPWPKAMMSAALIPTGDDFALKPVNDGINSDTRVPMASIAKNMTAFLVFEALQKGILKADQVIPIAHSMYCLPDNKFAVEALGGIDKIRVDQALTLLLRQSNNTVALALADAVAGSEDGFVTMMNERMVEWHLENTHFVNPHGLPQGDRQGEYTTAKDLTAMVQHFVAYDGYYKRYGFAEMIVGGKVIPLHENPIKALLRKLDGGFKSGTSDRCHSFLAWFKLENEFRVSVSLCAPNAADRYVAVTSLLKENGLFKLPEKPADKPPPARTRQKTTREPILSRQAPTLE